MTEVSQERAFTVGRFRIVRDQYSWAVQERHEAKSGKAKGSVQWVARRWFPRLSMALQDVLEYLPAEEAEGAGLPALQAALEDATLRMENLGNRMIASGFSPGGWDS